MRRIIDYGILAHQDGVKLRDLVVEAISDGWQPLGGLTTHMAFMDGDTSKLYRVLVQAMARYEETVVS